MKYIPENTSKNTHNVVAALLFADQSHKRVLDIPSGAGAFTQRLLTKKIEVHSGDIDNFMEVENPNFRQGNMNERLPYDDGFFDAVVCIDGIEHLERPFDFIQECSRITRKEGAIIFLHPTSIPYDPAGVGCGPVIIISVKYPLTRITLRHCIIST